MNKRIKKKREKSSMIDGMTYRESLGSIKPLHWKHAKEACQSTWTKIQEILKKGIPYE